MRIISAVITSIHVISSEYCPSSPFTVVAGTSFTRMLAWWNMYLHRQSVRFRIMERQCYSRVPMQAEEITHCRIPGVAHEIVERPHASRSINPLLQRTSWEIAVVVDKCSPARHDVESSITVICNGSRQRPECALWVAKGWPRVVSHHIDDTIIHPGLNGICVE